MLMIQEQLVKIGGVILPGQIKSIEIQESASIDEIEDDKGTTKSNQPTGYDAAKVIVEILLEDAPDKTTVQQIQEVERLFKAEGQKVSNLLEIVCEDCLSRGISMVYFKNFSTKRVISESIQVASLELWTPMIAEIKTKKVAASNSSGSSSGSKAKSKSGSSSGSGSKGSSGGKTLTAEEKKKLEQAKKFVKDTVNNVKTTVDNTIKKIANSPAVKDIRDSSLGKLAAKTLLRK